MLGVELVTDRKEKTPAKQEASALFEKLKGTLHCLICWKFVLIVSISKFICLH